jgi:glycosidase
MGSVLAPFVVGTTGCGSDVVQSRDFGSPPDLGFDPGRGGAGDGYGSSGGDQGKNDNSSGGTPVMCPDDLKACAHEFTFPFGNENSVELRGDFGGPDTWAAGVPMMHSGNVWKVTVNVPYGKKVEYKFVVNGTNWTVDPAQPTVTAMGNTNNAFEGTTCMPALCTDQGSLPPGVFDWRDATIYFVFVDRFYNGNPANDCNVANVSGGPKSIANYQGGDWAGVTQKINEGYFNDLGINTLWVTVPFENADVAGAGVGGDTHMYSAYHGYWPKLDDADPKHLVSESCFGGLTDLKTMVAAAHAKGLKVLYDFAMVHVHDTSGVFNQHKDWFWPNDNGHGGDCICGSGCSWDTVPEREHCWFTNYLPHWNYTNADARNYSVTNAIEWIKQTGVDGFRADAIKHVDISWLTTLRSRIQAEILAPQMPQQRFYMVGETYDFGNRDLLKSYVDPTTKLDGQFDFPYRANLVNSVLLRIQKLGDLRNFMDSNDYFYGPNAVMSPFVGNHDLPRAIHLAANNRLWGDNQGADGKDRGWQNQPTIPSEREAFERMANAFGVLLTNRGAPLVYYGDEIGLPGAGDPDNRRFMQWTGLDANQTYLRDRLKRLLAIRAAHAALRRGVRDTKYVDDDTWVYARSTAGDSVYVALNRSDVEKPATGLPAGALHELVEDKDVAGGAVTLPPRQLRVFVAK